VTTQWSPLKKLNKKPGLDFNNLTQNPIYTADLLYHKADPPFGCERLPSMRVHLYHYPIGKNMLGEKFTLKEIQLFYETMLGKKLNASNFPNKLISLGLLEKLDEKKSIGAHRSPTFYKFNSKVYSRALKEGLVLA
jgi:hypothetical protein